MRTAFWLMIVILILPTDAQNQRQVYGAAKAAAMDISSFCSRNPNVCRESKIAFGKFKEKAKFGGKLFVEFFRKEPPKPVVKSSFFSSPKKTSPRQYTKSPANTLSANDLKPLWGLGI